MTEEAGWEAVVASTIQHFGKLDILVNNAGISGNSVADLYSTEGWHRIISINATSVFLGTKHAVKAMLGKGGASGAGPRSQRIALIGLRGAGKSTLGQRLADDLGFAFVELSREIEKFAGCSIGEIQSLYGQTAYRRYERRALEEAIQIHPEAVIATPGGMVSDAATFNLLLAHCTTLWLQANPQDHMQRVTAQGDLRPMAASKEAMEDLRQILAGRAAFYSQADFRLDTSAAPLEPTFQALRTLVREALQLPA